MMTRTDPARLWRYGAREMNLLALDMIALGLLDAIPSAELRTRVVGRALGLEIEKPYRPGQSPDSGAEAVWKAYRFAEWTADIGELFGVPDIPESHPCATLYGIVSFALSGLSKVDTCESSVGKLVEAIIENHYSLADLHHARPPCADNLAPDEAGYRINQLPRLLMEISPILRSSESALFERAVRIHSILLMSFTYCKAMFEGWLKMEPLPTESFTNPYRSNDDGLRRDARWLLKIAPESQKRHMLFHLADFHPEATDLQLFVERFQAGDSNALALIVKLWPGEVSVSLIERTLESGLSVSFEELMIPDPEKAGAFKETPLGRQVGSAISLCQSHLAPDRAFRYFVRYLERSPDPGLRAEAAKELGEMGRKEAGEALAMAAATASGRVLSNVAEAIQKVPTPEGLENLFSRLPDRTLRLDRLPVIETLIEHRPDERLRDRLLELTREPGCRCAGCVWRRALRKLATTWPDERSRSMVEDFFQKEPGYEGRIGAARILISNWPDARTIQLLRKGTERPVFGSGEGDMGHLPFDGKTDLSKGDRDEQTELYSSKLTRALWSEIEEFNNPATKESESSIRTTEMIRQLLIRESAKKSST